MRANVKPLTHWLIYKGYTVRFTSRSPDHVTGVMTTPGGAAQFTYNPQTMQIATDDGIVAINEHGWEIEQDAHE